MKNLIVNKYSMIKSKYDKQFMRFYIKSVFFNGIRIKYVCFVK